MVAYFGYLMCLITIQYIPIDDNVAFLNIKTEEIKLDYYKVAFFSHVYTSLPILILGILQFSKLLRVKFPQLHKKFGWGYVLLILLISAPSGFIMAVHANGGIWSKTSFVLQAILWFSFTLNALIHALKHNWKEHFNSMLRSFALTLSAISLRLFKWIIVSTFALPPMDTYKIVSWLGWGVNILIVEIYIISKKAT
ncbi:DUF2306 domain-containing protein [Limibacter armeniacum]|uniref:DUF2306 domain-containing protein n=1 Tax=Limibacter armeniacum TaxID=466084 RepID=UPI002FE62F12